MQSGKPNARDAFTAWPEQHPPLTGDTLARFTSRRLDRDQPVQEAWAQAESEAAAERAAQASAAVSPIPRVAKSHR